MPLRSIASRRGKIGRGRPARAFRSVIAALLALCAPGAVRSLEAPGPPTLSSKPSLLLITLDTTRADHLGCYGRVKSPSPAIDELARQGVRFEDALAPVPLTLPSHSTMLTGLSARAHGVRENEMFRLPQERTTLAEILKRAGYQTAAFISSSVLDRQSGIDQGFDTFDDNIRIGERIAFDYRQRAASQVTLAALDSPPRPESPFFLWVHYFDPHLPYVPPEPYRSRFPDRLYDGEIAFMDDGIAHLLDGLEKLGLLRNCVIVVAGDHGESLGEHGEGSHGVFIYQSTQRVPLLIKGPGVPAGRVVRSTVGLVDLMPTVLELLGQPVRGEGRSLVPLMHEARTRAAGPDYELESLYGAYKHGWSPLRGIVSGPWKYIDAPRPELYERLEDPGEKRNLFESERATARKLQARLARLVGSDPVLPTPPDPQQVDSDRRRQLEALGYVGGNPAGDLAVSGGPPPDPKDVIDLVPRLEEARRLLHDGKGSEAVLILREIIARNPTNVMAHAALGSSLAATGDLEGAIQTARRVVALNPRLDMAYQNLGVALGTKAILLSQRGRTREPAEGPQQGSQAGGGEEEEGWRLAREAAAAFERALQISPRYAETILSWARMNIELRRPDEARSVLLRGRAAGIGDPDLELELGRIDAARGDLRSAADALERSLALNGRSEAANELAGRVWFQLGEFGKAAERYGLALDLSGRADLARTLGSIRLYKLDDPLGALAAFRRALELDPDGPESESLREIINQLAGPESR